MYDIVFYLFVVVGMNVHHLMSIAETIQLILAEDPYIDFMYSLGCIVIFVVNVYALCGCVMFANVLF